MFNTGTSRWKIALLRTIKLVIYDLIQNTPIKHIEANVKVISNTEEQKIYINIQF